MEEKGAYKGLSEREVKLADFFFIVLFADRTKKKANNNLLTFASYYKYTRSTFFAYKLNKSIIKTAFWLSPHLHLPHFTSPQLRNKESARLSGRRKKEWGEKVKNGESIGDLMQENENAMRRKYMLQLQREPKALGMNGLLFYACQHLLFKSHH